jgi:cell division protein FtsB
MIVVLHELRRRARFLVGPFLGFALASYFVYHTVEGDRGLRAWRDINQQLRVASDQFATVEAERDALEHKVAGLNPNHVDPDLLDQQIRMQLDLVSPSDIILMQPSAPN